jgi:hypothetical protein
MSQITKAIGHYVRQEGSTVTLDFKLPSNEIVVMTQHDVVMVDRKDAPGLGIDLN